MSAGRCLEEYAKTVGYGGHHFDDVRLQYILQNAAKQKDFWERLEQSLQQ